MRAPLLTLLLAGLVHPLVATRAAEQGLTEIDSLAALAVQAGRSGVHVRMKPGVYALSDPSFARPAEAKPPDPSGRTIDAYRVNSLLHFSGRDSVYDLTGVVIHLDTKLHQAVRNPFDKILVSGERLILRGLTVIDQGDTPPGRGGLRMLHVIGNGNRIEEVSLYSRGSAPYGYGNLLGKGAHALVSLQKQSCLLITGCDNRIVGARVIARVFGHGIVMQGAVNTWIERCYVEGEMRLTDDMLKETSGPAFAVGFKSDYPPGHIVPGKVVALSEDGIRAYSDGSQVGQRRTENITVLDCTVKNMRSGFDLSAAAGAVRVSGCAAVGCNEKGYSVPSRAMIERSSGDASYGPLLSLWDKNARDCRVELTLIGTNSVHPPDRIAEINGVAHRIMIKSADQGTPARPAPIVLGESFWADVHHFREPTTARDRWTGARGIELRNETTLPVALNATARDCVIHTRGEILRDDGANNQIRALGTSGVP